MYKLTENEIVLSGVSAMIGLSHWSAPENWTCPESSYVVCQRLSDNHSALKMETDALTVQEAYPHVRSLGFMPAAASIRLLPLNQPLRTVNCFYDRSFFERATEIDAGQWRDHAGPFMQLSSKCLETMMQRIHAELVHPGFGADLVIEAASTMILVEMARLGQRGITGVKAANARLQSLAPWQLRRVRERMAASAELGYPSILELSQLCGISSSHMMRCFKTSTGLPLHKYIAEERIERAKQLLAENRLTIKEISARLNFCSTAYFTTAFSRQTGLAPSEFRQRAKALQNPAARDILVGGLN